ncbi:MAG: EAL domain-containing protein [Betaproteobacteria bacterium]|nr:EAL domain-containing protein [Betaproteobacteria bacterium]MBU6511926.1 EAL domain-containing protein [Betaproteobacteria bacterium]MDE1954156.1 EAL domain-containing protein [Betaproteobacteria bacterium]MDE2152287.1 EAL domain-containing protein [Betaproteobacteria bacterium]
MAALLLCGAFCASVAWESWRATREHALSTLQASADVYAQDLREHLDTRISHLRQIAATLPAKGDASASLRQALQLWPDNSNLLLLGADGRVLASARQPAGYPGLDPRLAPATREAWLACAAGAERCALPPVPDAARPGRWLSAEMLRIAQDRWLVVVHPHLLSPALQALLAAYPQAGLTVVRDVDGLPQVGYPVSLTPYGQAQRLDLPLRSLLGSGSGSYQGALGDRGQRSLGAWVRVNGLPYVVIAAVPRSALVARWARGLLPYAALLLGLTLIAGWMFLLEMRRLLMLQKSNAQAMFILERLSTLQSFRARTHELIAGAGAEPELLRDICAAAVELCGLRLAWIGRIDAQGQLQVVAAAGATSYLEGLPVALRAHEEPAEPFADAWRGGLAQLHDDLAGPGSTWSGRAAAHAVHAAAALPIRRHGRLDAVLSLYWSEALDFDPEYANVLRDMGEDIGRGLERLDLIAAQQEALSAHERQGELMRTVFSQIDVLIASRSEGELLETACTRLLEGGLFAAAWIGQPDEAGRVHVVAAAGHARETLDGLELRVEQDGADALSRTWFEGRRAVETEPDSPLIQPWQAYALADCTQEAVTLPLRRSGRLWAMLVLVAIDSTDLDAIVQDTLLRTAELISQALTEIDLKQLLQARESEQAHLARHDALTGLANRLALEQHLPHAMARARRGGHQLAIGVLDLDDFKPVNDTYGHAAGDRLLQQLATRLQAQLRESDLLARLGGDEFVLVLDELDAAHPRQVLTTVLGRLHRAVEQPFELSPGVQAEVGMSMGLALYPEHGDEPDSLLRQADGALYAAKGAKARRQRWWLLSGEQVDDAQQTELEPYGEEAAELLEKVQSELAEVDEEFLEAFWRQMAPDSANARIVSILTDEELLGLKAHQTRHLRALLAPRLQREEQESAALRLGRVHAMIGVDSAAAMDTLSQYGAALQRATQRLPLRLDARVRLQTLLQQRLSLDLHAMQRGALEVQHQRQAHLAAMESRLDAWEQSGQLPRHVVAHLGDLPGVCGVACGRPDADNRYVLEFGHGEAQGYLQALRDAGLDLDFRRGALERPGATQRAWTSGAISTDANELAVPEFAPIASQFGVRSVAAIPLLDRHGHVHQVITLLGRHPGQFEAPAMRMWLESAQHHLGPAFQRALGGPTQQPIAATRRSRLHDLLYGGGLRLHVQPLVNLVTGQPDEVEVLARLQDGDNVLMPGAFLEAFGNHELRILFRKGLELTLHWLRTWDAQGLHLGASLNLPPSVLMDPECPQWIAQALEHSRVDATRLHLELLESHEDQFDSERRDEAIASLSRLGVRLIMDDLGSGYSSLRRMRSLPFHTVKIDQHIVQQAQDEPVKTIAFVGALVRMAQGLNMQVTMEGLESPDLVEMALALGVERGQGYALARPMPAEHFAAWAHKWHWELDAGSPDTALGRQALLYSRDIAPLDWQRIIVSHQQYRDALMRSLDGQGTPLQWRVVCRDDACLLGRWMRRHADTIWPSTRPVFLRAQQLHTEFHRQAGELLREAEESHRPDRAMAELAAGALDRASDRLVRALHQLSWTIGAAGEHDEAAEPAEQAAKARLQA